ncbi:MAG: hypothetical protein COT17_05470 [Elusimicrobia bacterium CG08_land_8_20_14_0_20_51_18]|nr:MAG: hypothetical protein COT17_05470 [Elusimicrobia bacterium CG08_land_8_20_14_0_20_51_18]
MEKGKLFFIFYLFIAMTVVLPVHAGISSDIKLLGERLIEGYRAKPPSLKVKKISVLNFDELGAEAKKNQIGQAVSAFLIQEFSGYPELKVVEREKLHLILKELELNFSGAISPDEIKRTGLILGVDYLLLGSVIESENQFLIQARIVDVETAEVVTAQSVTTDKKGLIEKSVEFRYLQRLSGISVMAGRTSFGKLSFAENGIGTELYYILPNRNVLSFEIFKTIGDNANIFGREQWDIQAGIPYTVEAKETVSSFFCVLSKYKVARRLSEKSRIYLTGGFGLYALNTEQYFSKLPFGSVAGPGVNLPERTSQKYAALGINVGVDVQRYITPFLRVGVVYSFYYFSFNRNLNPGDQNQDLMPQIRNLNKRIYVKGKNIGARITFSF